MGPINGPKSGLHPITKGPMAILTPDFLLLGTKTWFLQSSYDNTYNIMEMHFTFINKIIKKIHILTI